MTKSRKATDQIGEEIYGHPEKEVFKEPEFGISVELSLFGDNYAFVQWHGKKPQKIVFNKESLKAMVNLLQKLDSI